jgi:hypothetical protein
MRARLLHFHKNKKNKKGKKIRKEAVFHPALVTRKNCR